MNPLDRLPLLPYPSRIEPVGGALSRSSASDATWPRTQIKIESDLGAQSYRLRIAPSGILITAGDDAGAFYARMTLHQIRRLCPNAIPCGTIEDGPAIRVRGVMLDVSRDKVPAMATLFDLIDRLSEWKINHLQLYMEHTFAYRKHPAVWAEASPFTAAEIRALDAYCRDRFIELTPNQNSFGHFERWLRHAPYRALAECPDGYQESNGKWRDNPTTLDPTNPATLALIADLYAELLPNFGSRRFHIGCDETWELGQGRSRRETDDRGLGPVFFDYLGKLKHLALKHGRTALYWGDMVWNRLGDRLDLLDRDMIHVDWGYYRDYPFREHGEKLATLGIPFWVAPGTAVWRTLTGCNQAAFGSNRAATRTAIDCGAAGCLNTDWGDGGHWQHLPISFIGLAAGAAMAWNERRNDDDTIRSALDPHVFLDDAAVMGKTASALADTWALTAERTTQSVLLDNLLRGGLHQTLPAGMTQATLEAADAHLGAAADALADTRMRRPDAGLIKDEFGNNIRMARHACRLGLTIAREATADAEVRRTLADDMREIIADRRRLWLARNRPGGLDDSLQVLQQRVREYTAG